MSGGSFIDNSLEVIDAIINGNPNAALLCLAPASHSNVRQEALVQKRRHLEDRLLGSLALKCLADSILLLLFCCQAALMFVGFNLEMFEGQTDCRSFDVTETTLVFADSGHASDRRKKSQFGPLPSILLFLCGFVFPFALSSLILPRLSLTQF